MNIPKMPRAASDLLSGSYFGSRSARESLPTLSNQTSNLSERSLSARSEPALSSGGEMAELEHQTSAGGKAQAGEAQGGKSAQQKQQWGAWHAQVQQLWGSSSQLLARYTSGGKVASIQENCAMQSAWNPMGAREGESDRPNHVVIYICES
ncbi:hypothetical protein CLOM_g11598 [Closterium sp. NIES-68]|nr:hypothetical protein CLOM_g11598 [Closterium sp. NIES-68]GJP70514.1 hypothetical protein CLOP_g1447 [Closterium sp. NIES-67]